MWGNHCGKGCDTAPWDPSRITPGSLLRNENVEPDGGLHENAHRSLVRNGQKLKTALGLQTEIRETNRGVLVENCWAPRSESS